MAERRMPGCLVFDAAKWSSQRQQLNTSGTSGSAHPAGSLLSMTELPPLPTDPADLQAWVANLEPDDLMALAQGLPTGGLSAFSQPKKPEIDLPPPEKPSLLTVTVELQGSKPRIWRRLNLPGDLTLDAVHTLLQAVMGWSDSHLHRFSVGAGNAYNQPYFITQFDEEEGEEGVREEGVRLDQLLRTPGDQLTYLYDFGDDWTHRITLEAIAPLTQENQQPKCVAGARACPPEDVGGIWAHNELAAWLRAGAPADDLPSQFSDVQHARDWLPSGYDPDAFDADEATEAMREWAAGEHLPWHSLPEPLADLIESLHDNGWSVVSSWLEALGPRQPEVLSEEELQAAARPWVALLQAVGSGTKLTAAGYMPPVTVEQVAQASGVTDWWIGKANREDLTWPVAELRESAQALGLVRKTKGMLTPTARARAALDNPRELVDLVLARLPLGKGFEAEAGWFALLGHAAGVSGMALSADLAKIMAERWRMKDGSQVNAQQAARGARQSLGPLEASAGGHRKPDPLLLRKMARAALFGLG